MPLHLIKLCVGADSIKDLKDWVAERIAAIGDPWSTLRKQALEPAVAEMQRKRNGHSDRDR